MIGSLVRGLFGGDGGVTHADVEKLAYRESFSEYLPWIVFDAATQQYINRDNTVGYLWECIPLTFACEKDATTLEALFRMDLPDGAVMQFILYPDPDIEPFIEQYRASKTRVDPLVKKNVTAFSDFLRKGVHGVDAMHGIPLRNFRSFVTLKSPSAIPTDMVAIIEETLKGVGMAPRKLPVTDFLEWLRRFFNKHVPDNVKLYDPQVPIRKQVIFSESTIDFDRVPHKIGYRYARCLTPKTTPKSINLLDTNALAGGIMGLADDSKQIITPFLWTVNVVFGNLKNEIHQKASLTMMQKASGSFAVQIQKRVDEFFWALDALDSEKFTRVIPLLWVFGDDEDLVRDSAARARRIWESQNYIMQEDDEIGAALFIAALPFGLYPSKNNLKILSREFVPPASTVARLLPMQADFIGSTNPVLVYAGRKGQVVGLDVFDRRVNNHNFLITAGSGAGKSFNLNYIVSNYYSAGALVRITDLGNSYKKLSRSVKGRFLDFTKEKMCINPFASSSSDREDADYDLLATATVISEMVYSASGGEMSETELTLIKEACRWAKARDGGEYGVDHVYEFLATFPKFGQDMAGNAPSIIDAAHVMAYNLREFTSHGVYGRFFNGKSTFDISQDQFVVLELEQLKPQTELFKVVTLQILNAVTQDVYLSKLADRSTRRFCLFDEAWQYFGEAAGGGSGGVSGSRIGRMVEEGYRRARKYGCAFGLVTQSLNDLPNFGSAGQAIKNNSAFKFLLEASDYPEAVRNGLIDYEGLALDLLISVKNRKPYFSEMFVDTPFSRGVVRLCVDPWTYYVNTSDADEVARFESLIDRGYSPDQALSEMSGITWDF